VHFKSALKGVFEKNRGQLLCCVKKEDNSSCKRFALKNESKNSGKLGDENIFFTEGGGGGRYGSRFFNPNPPAKKKKKESIWKKISSQCESFFLQKPDGEENMKREQISFAVIRLSSLFPDIYQCNPQKNVLQ